MPKLSGTDRIVADQGDDAASLTAAILTGLDELSARDATYVVLARRMALAAGANPDTITDRASAIAYVTGRADWAALPAAARTFLGDFIIAAADALTLALRRTD